MRAVVRPRAKRSWWKRASWWIWCTIGPQIHHEARILHRKVKIIALTSEIMLSARLMSTLLGWASGVAETSEASSGPHGAGTEPAGRDGQTRRTGRLGHARRLGARGVTGGRA